MRNSFLLLIGAALSLAAQETSLESLIKINLPPDSPLLPISTNFGQSRANARGGAMVLDLHMELSLRNSGSQTIRGVTLLVLAQEMTPGGKASVAVPSLRVEPGQSFPVRIDLRLLRPLQAGTSGPLVQVMLDGVLFDGFGFYGPNRLNSRRSMTVWETEAERDRRYFRSVLKASGPGALQREMLDSLQRQEDRPRLDVKVTRGRSVTSAADTQERMAKFAFLKFPDSPVEPVEGWAEISGNEARSPHINVLNHSRKPVRYVEIGWIIRDIQGQEFLAGSVPASDQDMLLPPGRTGRVLQDTALRFFRNAHEAVGIASMTGFVSQVEYTDDSVWVPNRSALQNAQLLRVLAPSPEEQRLTDLYRKKGIGPLIEELRKF